MNTAKNEIRKRSRRPAIVAPPLQDMADYLTEDSEKRHLQKKYTEQEIFEQAFSRLTSEEREILTLKDGNEFTYKEIAEMLSISVSASKMRVQRARRSLKALYEEYANER